MKLLHARGEIPLERTVVMGIVNRTPDSFFDGGRMELRAAVEHGLRLAEEGAAILDVGAVRAGPGEEVTEAEETQRLIPLIEELARQTEVALSVETARPGVAEQALAAGASIVNDVSALADPRLAEVCAAAGAALIVMHNGGQIRGRPRNPRYEDVTRDVGLELDRLAGVARAAGVRKESIVIDPGLDFGKNTFQSLELLRNLSGLTGLGWPVLIAASRKDVVGETLDLGLDERLEGSLAVAAWAASHGASIVRVHDVEASVRVAGMIDAITGRGAPAAPVRGLWD